MARPVQARGDGGRCLVAHHRGHAQSTDSVTLSDSARSVASARTAVQNAPDVRQQKVADIKQQLSDGTYQVSSRVLAGKMLDASARN